MLISGELHKPTAILMCFPLLMSRVGRGAIILMIALPITNFLEAWTAIIAILCAAIGILNMSLGWRDGVVELKYAEEGVPERGTFVNNPNQLNKNPTPPKHAGMQPLPQASPGPAAMQTPQQM